MYYGLQKSYPQNFSLRKAILYLEDNQIRKVEVKLDWRQKIERDNNFTKLIMLERSKFKKKTETYLINEAQKSGLEGNVLDQIFTVENKKQKHFSRIKKYRRKCQQILRSLVKEVNSSHNLYKIIDNQFIKLLIAICYSNLINRYEKIIVIIRLFIYLFNNNNKSKYLDDFKKNLKIREFFQSLI
ncbi:hypothetical protein pb186bvf_000470 [Paramecium bursaria]